MSTPSRTDLDLLRGEIELLWGVDDRGRCSVPPLAAVAVGSAAADDDEPPADLLAVRGALPPSVIISCLSYVIDGTDLPQAPPDVSLRTSREPVPPGLVAARPDPEWEESEWSDLLAGRLGPWSVALVGSRVAAVCHTPRDRHPAAEVGVWTHPDHRGRGLAGLVTAAWAAVAGESRTTLYYSHFDDNHSSRSVARKLGARPIGRIWQLRQADSSG